MKPRLVTAGGLTVDNVIAADGRVALAQAGGNGAYSAVGALVFEPCVGLISHAVESYPKSVIEELERGGIDLKGVRWSPAQLSACNWFIYDEMGHREEGLTSPPEALAASGFRTDHLSPDEVAAWRAQLERRDTRHELTYSQFRTDNPLTPDQVPGNWRKARGVHLAPSQPGVMDAMLDVFEPQRAIITADPGWQLAALTLEDITPILARLDAFLPSEVELKALVPGASISAALEAIAQRTKGAVAVKLGKAGALVWDSLSASPVAVPAVSVTACDPTGAGDSFCGGFLAGLVETGDLVKAAHFGAVSASRAVLAFGAEGALPVDRPAARATLSQLMAEVSPCP
ncbi:MAG: carbohydrate kinase family protein [Pseudomonadota bacterium]